MKLKGLILLMVIIQGCDSYHLTEKYEAYWYETYHQIILSEGNKYEYKFNGHLGNGEYNGEYEIFDDTLILKGEQVEINNFLISEDDCLIELETRFEYCKQNQDEWETRKRSINYPQLKERTIKEKEEVLSILERALTNPKIRNYFKDTTKSLIIQEYYEIRKENNISVFCFGKPVELKSKKEIELEGIEEYLIIDEINIGLTSAMVDFQIMPEFNIGILDFFTRDNNLWNLNKRERL